jgi:hypothetical protein
LYDRLDRTDAGSVLPEGAGAVPGERMSIPINIKSKKDGIIIGSNIFDLAGVSKVCSPKAML